MQLDEARVGYMRAIHSGMLQVPNSCRVLVRRLLLLFTTLYTDGKYVQCDPAFHSLHRSHFPPETGLNLYDVRKRCSVPEYGPECFPEIGWLENWINGEDVKRSLGVDPTLTFEACKADVNKDFALQADAMQDSALLLTDLVNEGVRLLVYAGNAGQHTRTTLETPLRNSNAASLAIAHRCYMQLHG